MAKDPAFLFYPNDYIGGTMGMTFEQKGAYIELLMTQFNRGHMTSHMIGQVLGQSGGHLWDTIKDKFEVDAKGRFYNSRLEEEKNKRKRYTESRKNNIEGKNQYSKSGHMGGHMTSHMENEDENRNIIDNETKNLANEISEKFNFSELSNFNQYSKLCHFIKKIGAEKVRQAFDGYWRYKESNDEKPHGIKGWMGEAPDYDGGWNSKEWHKMNGTVNKIDWEKA